MLHSECTRSKASQESSWPRLLTPRAYPEPLPQHTWYPVPWPGAATALPGPIPTLNPFPLPAPHTAAGEPMHKVSPFMSHPSSESSSSFLPVILKIKSQLLTTARQPNGMQACPDHPPHLCPLSRGGGGFPALRSHQASCRGLGT